MEKILVVNNDIDTMNLLKKWLEKKTYQVEYTSNIDSAIDIVKHYNPSLVIVDIMQKEVAYKIKSNAEIKNTPVLLMTGYTSKNRGRDVPFNDIIEKPFDLDLLQKKIEKLIESDLIRN